MLRDLLKKNRSYRRFSQDNPICYEELFSYIDAARYVASAANKQLIKYFIISGSDCERIFPFITWAALLDWSGPTKYERPSGYILICSKADKESPDIDIGIAAQSICLLAAESARGSCILGALRRDEIAKEFSLPKEWKIRIALAFGSPGEKILLEEVQEGEHTSYYRTPDGVHHVPKKKLSDILITKD